MQLCRDLKAVILVLLVIASVSSAARWQIGWEKFARLLQLGSSRSSLAAREHFLSPSSRVAAVPPSLAASLPEGTDDVATVWRADAFPRLSQVKEEGTPPFDLELAKLMGRLTSVAYCSDAAVIQAWNCTRCLYVPDFQTQEVTFDEQWDLLAYVGYLPSLNAIAVAFRGTDSSNWGNWINNMKAWRQDKMYPIPEAPHALVHAGFYRMWTESDLKANVTRAVMGLLASRPTARLLVTGHSMGGALGSLCAMDLKFKLNFTDVRVWTFGSPRVGNYAFQQLFNSIVTESWRFTHNRDVVPSLPPTLIGFHHVSREVWSVDVDSPAGVVDKLLMCDDSGEDPSCHNSACYLGLCTSVADHLTYLSLPMYKSLLEC